MWGLNASYKQSFFQTDWNTRGRNNTKSWLSGYISGYHDNSPIDTCISIVIHVWLPWQLTNRYMSIVIHVWLPWQLTNRYMSIVIHFWLPWQLTNRYMSIGIHLWLPWQLTNRYMSIVIHFWLPWQLTWPIHAERDTLMVAAELTVRSVLLVDLTDLRFWARQQVIVILQATQVELLQSQK